jgi:hypothetical protein
MQRALTSVAQKRVKTTLFHARLFLFYFYFYNLFFLSFAFFLFLSVLFCFIFVLFSFSFVFFRSFPFGFVFSMLDLHVLLTSQFLFFIVLSPVRTSLAASRLSPHTKNNRFVCPDK